jgi:uncharacterized coiled-coil protein SlyX
LTLEELEAEQERLVKKLEDAAAWSEVAARTREQIRWLTGEISGLPPACLLSWRRGTWA